MSGNAPPLSGIFYLPPRELSGSTLEQDMRLFKRPGSKFWQIEYRDAVGRDTRRSSRTANEAEALTMGRALDHGNPAPVFDISAQQATMTFAELFEKCLSYWKVEFPRSMESYYLPAGVTLLPEFGHKQIHLITREDVRDYRRKRVEIDKLTPATANRNVAVLKTALNLAVSEFRILGVNPAGQMKALKEPPGRECYIPRELQPKYFQQFTEETDHLFVRLAVGTGMRKGNCSGLLVRDIDFGRSWITLTKTKSNTTYHIPVLPQLLVALRKQCDEKKPDELVFTPRRGELYEVDRRKVRAAGIAIGIPKLRFHDLRHTFAANFMSGGGNLYTLQKFMGHSSIKMTERYAHFSPNYQKSEVENYVRYMEDCA